MTRNNYFLIQSVLQNSNANKQRLGQRIAIHLGLNPGPRGQDNGIDGSLNFNGKMIHFQSKLRSVLLDREDARSYFSDIEYHKVDISIMLSGLGYKETFIERLYGHESINKVDIHLLTLNDIFSKSDNYLSACNVLPSLYHLDKSIKEKLNE